LLASRYVTATTSPITHLHAWRLVTIISSVQLRPEKRAVSEDGRPYELLVESSVPVPCPEEPPCALTLQLSTSSAGEAPPLRHHGRFPPVPTVPLSPGCVTDEDVLGADLSLSSCVVDLTRGPCRDGVCGRALIHFSAVTDFVNDGDRTTRIAVKPIVTQNSLWSGYSPEPVEVEGLSYLLFLFNPLFYYFVIILFSNFFVMLMCDIFVFV